MNTIKMGSNIGTLKITQVGLKLGTLIVIKEGKKKNEHHQVFEGIEPS